MELGYKYLCHGVRSGWGSGDNGRWEGFRGINKQWHLGYLFNLCDEAVKTELENVYKIDSNQLGPPPPLVEQMVDVLLPNFANFFSRVLRNELQTIEIMFRKVAGRIPLIQGERLGRFRVRKVKLEVVVKQRIGKIFAEGLEWGGI